MNDPNWRFSLQALFVATAAVEIVAALAFYATVNPPLCGLVFGAFTLVTAMYVSLRGPSPLTSVAIVQSAHRREEHDASKCLPHQPAGPPDPTVSAGPSHL